MSIEYTFWGSASY